MLDRRVREVRDGKVQLVDGDAVFRARPSGSLRAVRSPFPCWFHPAAEPEFLAAIDWYAARDAGVAELKYAKIAS